MAEAAQYTAARAITQLVRRDVSLSQCRATLQALGQSSSAANYATNMVLNAEWSVTDALEFLGYPVGATSAGGPV